MRTRSAAPISRFRRFSCALIRSRMLLSSARRWARSSGRGADAEQLIERQPRIANHRQRLILVGPADRVGVDAGVAIRAAARLVDRLDAQLHRRDRRLLAELLRVDLVERHAGAHVRPLRLPRMRLRQEHRARAEVIAADLRQLERLGVAHVGVADDREVVAERFERGEAGRRQIEARAHGRRRPQVLLQAELGRARGAVHHLDGGQPHLAGCRLGEHGARRHHRLDHRQRHRHTHAAQDRAARNVLPGDEHRLSSPLHRLSAQIRSLSSVRRSRPERRAPCEMPHCWPHPK